MGAGHTTLSSAYVEEDATEPLHEDYAVDQRLFPGSGRMMRTFRLSHRQTGSSVVAKTMWVQHPQEEQVVNAQEKELQRIKKALEGSPHIATFWLWRIGNIKQEIRPVVLVRNYIYTTLADRLESRPFLTHVEKLWIIFQLLHAIQCMHDAGVVHGFLTTENIGLTSWNYLVILDIASYKARTALPDDDPSEYRYYFQEYHKHGTDTTQREKRCYLAPERFYSPKVDGVPTASALTTKSMDIFSAGCILLETSLNGERAMDLGHLMDYRKNKSFPPQVQQKFQKIESSSLRAACRHMMHLDATQRLSPNEYLERLQDIMPCTFSETFEPLIERITNTVKTPDARIALAAANYNHVLVATVGINDDDGKKYFANVLGPSFCLAEDLDYSRTEPEETKISVEAIDHAKLMAETESLLKRLQVMDWDEDETPSEQKTRNLSKNEEKRAELKAHSPDSLLIYIQLILVSMRHVYRPSSKIIALELLDRLAKHSSDETRLQRIIPSTISLLQDQDPLVRALALKVMTKTLSIIQSFPPSDSKIFPQYIFKRVAHLITDPSLVVRITFSNCIAVLAETSRRFLDISHAVRLYEAVGGGSGSITPDDNTKMEDGEVFNEDVTMLLDGPKKPDNLEQQGSKKTNQTLHSVHSTLITNTYDSELSALHEVVSRFVVHISTDPSEQSSSPKRALLRDLARLCNFFGSDGVMTFILPQVLAFLNDRRDWQLRAALFKDLPSLCYVIGRAATEHFVLPCLETALVDSEDQVLAAALTCLASLVDLSLLSRSILVDTSRKGSKDDKSKLEALFKKYIPLLLHPADSVRHSAILFVNSCCNALGSPDADVFLVPSLRPYIRFEPSEHHLTTVAGLDKCLVAPWTRKQMNDQLTRLRESGFTNAGEQKPLSIEENSLSSESMVDIETNSHVLEYLKMLSRSRSNKAESSSEVGSKLAVAIEGSLKLSQNIKFPTQTVAATMENSIPNWFTNAREIAKSTNSGSEFSALQSVSALNQVFGLSIMRGAEDTPGVFEHAAATVEDCQIDDKELRDMLMDAKAKQVDSAIAGEWGSECVLDPSLNMTTSLVAKLKGLEVPTLSPRLGISLDNNSARQSLSKGMGDWRPKMECLAATSSPLGGHSGPVSRLAVSFDQRFFVSASYDSTCKVWELGKIDSSPGIMESSLTYSGHNIADSSTRVRINDVALLESSHSVASASSDGRVHIWRVDMVPTNNQSPSFGKNSSDNARVSGSTVVKTIDSTLEGEILAISHYNSLSRSVLAFATQRGSVHSWDLRSENEPFQLKHEAHLGYLTSMALGTDRNWIITGSSKGFVALWDIRWPSMVKLWHHSGSKPITRLAASYANIPSGKPGIGPRPLMFISSGNECGMFDISDGTCRQGFRVLASDGYYGLSTSAIESMSLTDIDCVGGRSLGRKIRQNGIAKGVENNLGTQNGPDVNAMVGSMGGYDQNYLITGGSDAYIRYWDFSAPTKCYTVSGQVASHGRPAYERVDFPEMNRLMLCRQNTGLRPQDFESSKIPRKLQRGHARAESRHRDAILDLKLIRNPIKAIISSSRDGTIKLFK